MIRRSKIRCHSLVIFIVSSLSNVQKNNFNNFYRPKHVLSPSAESILSGVEGLRVNSVEGIPRAQKNLF